MIDARLIIVTLVHLAALLTLTPPLRWLLATAFPAAAFLAWAQPDHWRETQPYSLGLIGATSLLTLIYRILYTLAADTPDPEGATLYSFALWALGLAGVTYIGYLVYAARYIFWERQGALFRQRVRGTEVLDALKRR